MICTLVMGIRGPYGQPDRALHAERVRSVPMWGQRPTHAKAPPLVRPTGDLPSHSPASATSLIVDAIEMPRNTPGKQAQPKEPVLSSIPWLIAEGLGA